MFLPFSPLTEMPNVGRLVGWLVGYVCHCNYLGADRKIIMGQKEEEVDEERERRHFEPPLYVYTVKSRFKRYPALK